MRWKLCVNDGQHGYSLYAWTKGDTYPRADCNLFYEAVMDDGTPARVNKDYVVLMYRDDEEAGE